jgi:hypothetical protein
LGRQAGNFESVTDKIFDTILAESNLQ